MIFYVYQLRVEGECLPFYVGKGFGRRAWKHLLPSSLIGKSHKINKIKSAHSDGKYIYVEFIKTGLSEDDAHMWEVFWIAEYGRADLGLGILTNHTDGGEGTVNPEKPSMLGRNHTEETRQKMSGSHSGKTMSKDAKQKIARTLSKSFRLVAPDGEVFLGTNLKQFCVERGLNFGNMSTMMNGKLKTCNGGWTGEYNAV